MNVKILSVFAAIGMATGFAMIEMLYNISLQIIIATVSIVTIVFAYKTLALKKKIDAQDETISEVKKDTTKTVATVEAIHKLTNGNFGEQLLISMVSAQTLASITNKTEHKTLAKVARAKYESHQKAEQAAAEQKQKDGVKI